MALALARARAVDRRSWWRRALTWRPWRAAVATPATHCARCGLRRWDAPGDVWEDDGWCLPAVVDGLCAWIPAWRR